MSKSSYLRMRDQRALFELAGECRDLGDDYPHWQAHFLAGLARLVSADISVGGEVTGIAAGQPQELAGSPGDWGFENGFDRRGWLRALELLKADPAYTCLLKNYFARGGQDQGAALRRTDLIDTHVWERSQEFDEVYRTVGVDHNICCFRFISGGIDDAHGGFLCRARGRRDFSVREQAVVHEAYAVIAPMIGGSLARVTEPRPSDLPPRVRQVLRCVLEGDGDKQIAARLQISTHTVNQYMKAIFRHFDVQSRPQLMARWIRRLWGGPFAWAND